jgi:hypothetical protein
MEIISGNKTYVLTAGESNAKKDAIVIAIGTKITSNLRSNLFSTHHTKSFRSKIDSQVLNYETSP